MRWLILTLLIVLQQGQAGGGENLPLAINHDGQATAICFDKAGHLVVANTKGLIQLFDEAGTEVTRLNGRTSMEPRRVEQLAVSADGLWLAAASIRTPDPDEEHADPNGDIVIWRLSRQPKRSKKLIPNTGGVIAFHPQAAKLAYVAGPFNNQTLHILDLSSPKKAQDLELSCSFKGRVYALTWSPDGKVLAVGSDAGNLYLVEVEKDKQIQLQTDTAKYGGLAFSPDGKTLVFLRAEQKQPLTPHKFWLQLWDVKHNRELTRLEGDWHFPSWSGAGLAAGGLERLSTKEIARVGIWNAASALSGKREPDRMFYPRPSVKDETSGAAGPVSFSKNGECLATIAGTESKVWLWRLK